jgi:hypothetical protein
VRGTGSRDASGSWSGVAALVLAASVAAALTASAYWPGLMTWDSIHQYDQAISGDIDDWHPPAMQWIWRQFLRVVPGPAPMLLLQLTLFWGGLALLAGTMWRGGRRRLAWAVLACGLLPLSLALTGAILKDCLVAGLLVMATALLAVQVRRGGAVGGLAGALFAGALLLLAAALRFNSFTACLPLAIAFLPRRFRSTAPRLVVTSAVAAIALLSAMPVANHLIGAKPSGAELSLIIFDLGGITEHSGVDVFPAALAVADPVGANHACYRPGKWDSYSYWVDPVCPLGFTAWNDKVKPDGTSPYAVWAAAVLAHPLAYAEHRLTHFALNTRLLPLSDAEERPVVLQGPPNPWGLHVTPNPLLHAIDTVAVASAHTPLGWPIVWMGLAFGAIIVGWRLPSARLIVALGSSSLLYGGGYLVLSVASELRYHLWTGIAALLATVMVVAEGKGGAEGKGVPRQRLVWAYLPAVLVTLAATAFRI